MFLFVVQPNPSLVEQEVCVVALEGQIPPSAVMASAQVWMESYLFCQPYQAPFALSKFNTANVIRNATPIRNAVIEK